MCRGGAGPELAAVVTGMSSIQRWVCSLVNGHVNVFYYKSGDCASGGCNFLARDFLHKKIAGTEKMGFTNAKNVL